MKTILLFLMWVGLFAIALGQKDDLSVSRISRFKILTGEGRLQAGTLLVKLRQDQRFTNSSTYFVSVTALDSSTALLPDSVRTFVIKNLSPTQFTIRSVKHANDTIKVRWLAVGE